MRHAFYFKAESIAGYVYPGYEYTMIYIRIHNFSSSIALRLSSRHPFIILFANPRNDLKGRHSTNCCYGLIQSIHPP